MVLEQTQQEKANQMIRNGSTPGMLLQHLRNQGLTEEQCYEVVRIAVNTQSRARQMKAIGWVLIGFVVLLIGGFGAFGVVEGEQEGRHMFQMEMRLAFMILMAGLILFVYGIVSYFQART